MTTLPLRACLVAAALALFPLALPALAASPASPAEAGAAGSGTLTRVRSFPAAEHGVPAPAAVVWSDRLGALVVAGDTKPGTRLAVVTPAERDLGGATVPAAQAASLSVDPRDGRIQLVAGGRLHSFAGEGVVTGKPEDRVGGPVPVTGIRGASPTGSGELLVLAGGNLVRLDNGRIVSSQPVQVPSGHDLRGLARDPQTGRLHTFDATAHQVLALDEDGAPVRVYDTTGLDVTDVRGLAFGPSADATDEPATQSLYLADAAGAVVEAAVDTTAVTALANVQPTSSRVVATSSYNPPSPDPSGIGYLPDQDRLLIDDGEVEEMTIYQGANYFVTNRAGSLADTGTTLPWSKEPTGVGYNAANKHLFVSDDSQLEVFEDAPGGDGRYGTGDDVVTHFDTAVFGSNDPEGVEYEAPSNSVWIADGVNREVYRVRAGSDGRFGTTDDIRSHFDTAQYGTGDPEGMAYDSVRDTILVLDGASQRIYELDKTGALLNTIDVTSVGMVNAAGLTVAPSSTGSGRSYYAVARGIDNDNHPTENDGRLYEITASLPATGGGVNQAPSVNAGADQTVALPSTAALDGTVDDDGLPNPPGAVTTTWTKASGPGTVTIANASATDTTATFSDPGTYVLRLTVQDGALSTSDEVTVLVQTSTCGSGGTVQSADVPIAAGSDDAEQNVSGATALTSNDLELVTDGTTQQVEVGTRTVTSSEVLRAPSWAVRRST